MNSLSRGTRRPTRGQYVERIETDGYVVLPDLVDGRELDPIRSQLATRLPDAPFGRNDFEGFYSQRLYALLAKAPAVAALVAHPAVLTLIDELLHPGYLLSANIAINVHPGETAQLLHADDAYCTWPRPRPAVGVSAVWAMDDFTPDNGATEVVPGSHKWASGATTRRRPAGAPDRDGRWIRGGVPGDDPSPRRRESQPDTRLGITPQYCEPWMRQIENMARRSHLSSLHHSRHASRSCSATASARRSSVTSTASTRNASLVIIPAASAVCGFVALERAIETTESLVVTSGLHDF